MGGVEEGNFFYFGVFVVNEDLKVKTAQQIQVYFIPVVSNSHNKRAMLVEHVYLLVER